MMVPEAAVVLGLVIEFRPEEYVPCFRILPWKRRACELIPHLLVLGTEGCDLAVGVEDADRFGDLGVVGASHFARLTRETRSTSSILQVQSLLEVVVVEGILGQT